MKNEKQIERDSSTELDSESNQSHIRSERVKKNAYSTTKVLYYKIRYVCFELKYVIENI